MLDITTVTFVFPLNFGGGVPLPPPQPAATPMATMATHTGNFSNMRFNSNLGL